jgi:hypothetical protein
MSIASDSMFMAFSLLHPVAEMDVANGDYEENDGRGYENEILHIGKLL